MPDDLDIPFDRITYRDGQRLTTLDLRDDHHRDTRLRQLHTRYLHETWGIALGFEVQRDATKQAVVVGPGYAVDGMGRELLLAEGIHLPVPTVPDQNTFVLTIGYQEDTSFRGRPELTSVCLGDGLDLRNERPSFSWRRPEEVRFGPQVPLVQVLVLSGAIQGELDFRVRRNARPLVRPHIGWGSTEPGRTGWRLWKAQGERGLGVEVIVDTSEAGFTKIPYYFALLHMPTDLDAQAAEGLSALLNMNVQPFQNESARFLDNLGFIAEMAEDAFTYRIIGFTSPESAEQLQIHISWLGLEPVAGCEPALDLTRLFNLAGFSILTRLAVKATVSET